MSKYLISTIFLIFITFPVLAQSDFSVPLPHGDTMMPDDFNPETDGNFG